MVRHVAPEQVPPRRVRLPELERADGRDDGVAGDCEAVLALRVFVRQFGSVQLQNQGIVMNYVPVQVFY